MTLPPLLRLCRIHQYTKNGFVFAPLFFAGNIPATETLLRVTWAFVAYCLAASAIYIINDLGDVAEDRMHPTKRLRPLAAGTVSVPTAKITAALLAVVGLGGTWLLVPGILPLLGFYMIMNLAYSLKLKHFSLVDITVISLGFVIRLYVGGVAADLPLSHWIVIITFLLALFLALAKRRDDVVLSAGGERTRAAVDGYNEMFLSTAMAIVAAVVLVAYLMYTVSDVVIGRVGHNHLYLTSGFVILGFMRYLQITFVEGRSGSPSEVVLKDRFLQAVILLWLALFAFLIY